MSDIAIGETSKGQVVVSDTSGDCIYQKGEKIKIDGRYANPSEVRVALQELGIGPLSSGVRLNPLAQYVEALKTAAKQADDGSPDGVNTFVANARTYAEQAGLLVDEARIKGIRDRLKRPK